jgi:hypothetical protein
VIELENVKTYIGVVTAGIALATGGYQAADKFGWLERPILEWAPEHFSISDGPVDGEFKVTVARAKLRDDCTVEGFILDVRDSELIVHQGTPSITTFMGPANNRVDTFAYNFVFDAPEKVAPGEATLIAYINYGCPEGKVVVQYPDHANLRFNVERPSQ